jgi:surface antigen
MNFYLIAAGFIVRSKHFKILALIMVSLIMLPAFAVVAVAAAPETLLEKIIDGSGTYSTVDPAPTGIAILGGFTFPGDTYALGNCTYWVFARRAQVGEPIPTSWGNADTWGSRAALDGYTVDHTPTQYAIMQSSVDTVYGPGHVAFVESVDPDGTWNISEMNVVGLYIVDHKAMPASAAANYNFIHTKE